DPSQPQNPNCTGVDAPHGPQPAGLVAMAHTPNLRQAIQGLTPVLTVRMLCPNVTLLPANNVYGYTGLLGANGDCMALSKPQLQNNLFWQNRAFSVNVVDGAGNPVGQNGGGTGTPTGGGNQSQQNLVALTPALVQTTTGACPAGANYWDIGL